LPFQRPPVLPLSYMALQVPRCRGSIEAGRLLQPSNGRWPNMARQPLAHDGCFLSQTEKSLVALACRIPIPSVFPVFSITLFRYHFSPSTRPFSPTPACPPSFLLLPPHTQDSRGQTTTLFRPFTILLLLLSLTPTRVPYTFFSPHLTLLYFKT
jgi:hypothetical protein